MATLVDYKGLQVVDAATEAGGEAIRLDFRSLVDWSPKSVWSATVDPGAGDDEDDDFYPGSMWLRTNVTPPKLFVCKTSAVAAAVWQQLPLELIQDTTPQLGGNLDVDGKAIGSASSSVVLEAGGRTSVTIKNSGGSAGSANEVFIGPTTGMPARGLPLAIESLAPGFSLYESDAGSNSKCWDFFASTGSLFFRCVNDAINGATNWLRLDRSGQTPSLLTISVNTQITGQITGALNHQQTYCDYSVATDGATVTFNLLLSDVHAVTLGGNRTLALSNAHAGQRFMVTLKQDATGSRTVTWWSGISWPGGTVPTLTTTANKSDVFEFLCTGTNTYIGRVWGQNF